MEKDPFYLFNNAVGQISQFLEDLAKCIAPDVGRTREKREKQLGTGVSTRLIFMPDFNRDIRLPLDVTKEAMVAHHARVFTLPQFAVLAADLLKARGEPTPMLFGWSGSMMPVDQGSAQDCFFDLVDFAKRQWKEQYNNIKGEEHSFVDEATASDVADFPLARSSKTGTGEGREGYRRHFDPIQKPAKGKGKGYGQQQRPIFQQAIECWKCGQYGHKSFECRSGWSRRQQWDSYGSYSSRSGGQAQWQSWNWRQGYSGKGWTADDWGRSTASSSSAAPPEPVRPPSTATPVPDSAPTADASAQAATGSAPTTEQPQQVPRMPLVIAEEYCEINGQPHFKRTYNDGTVEYESW